MKNLKKLKLLELLNSKKNKAIIGIVSTCVVLIAVMVIINLGDNQADSLIEETQPPAETAKLEPIATRKPVNRNSATATQKTKSSEGNSDTEPPVVDVTLAPVEIPDERAREIIEENNVQVATNPPVARTSPPKKEQRPNNAVTYIDGQKYVWDPVIGWIRSSGDGRVDIMDVESDGERYDGGW